MGKTQNRVFVPPPPTRFGAVPVQPKTAAVAGARGVPPPPTRFGNPPAVQAKAIPARHACPPPPLPPGRPGGAVAQFKVAAERKSLPPPPVGTGGVSVRRDPVPPRRPGISPFTATGKTAPVLQADFTFGPGFNAVVGGPAIRADLMAIPNADLVALRAVGNGVDIHFDLTDDVDPNPGLTSRTTWNPAGALPRARFEVTVAKWFVRAYDRGKVMSVFAHELGAHVLPYTPDILAVGGGMAPAGAFQGERQDHLNAANGGVVGGAYDTLAQDTALHMGGALNAEAQSFAHAYLMDLASIDNAGDRIKHPLFGNAATIANNYNFLSGASAWAGGYGTGVTSTTNVTSHYLGFYGKALGGMGSQAVRNHPGLATAAFGAIGALAWNYFR